MVKHVPDFDRIDETLNAFVRKWKGRIAPVKHITEKASSGPLEITLPGVYNVYGTGQPFANKLLQQLAYAAGRVSRRGNDDVQVYSFSELNIRHLENVTLRVIKTHAPRQLLVEVISD